MRRFERWEIGRGVEQFRFPGLRRFKPHVHYTLTGMILSPYVIRKFWRKGES